VGCPTVRPEAEVISPETETDTGTEMGVEDPVHLARPALLYFPGRMGILFRKD
jgi:hypothetical protein